MRSSSRTGSRILFVVVLLAVLVASCAPAAGRPTEEYVASAQDLIGEIASFAITLQPHPSMNYYSIETIGDRFITVAAESTFGMAILIGQSTTRITFTLQERGSVTVLASSGRGTNAQNDIDKIILHLATVFERI